MSEGGVRDTLPGGLRRAASRVPNGALSALLAAVAAAPLIAPAFLQPQNLSNVLAQSAITGVIALGMTIVIITGGIDLSVGAIVALVAVLVAGVQEQGAIVAVATALGAGAAVGALNGAGIAFGRVQPFIMTLAIMTAARGLAFVYSKGIASPIDLEPLDRLGSGSVLGFPLSSLVFVALLGPLALFMARVPAGRHIYAIGSNVEAARAAGVNVSRHLVGVYAASGLTAAVGGILFVSQQGVGTALAGVGYELNAIVAVVLGGASLTGGAGSLIGTSVGTVALAVISNVLNLSGVSPFAQDVFKGVIIVATVLARRSWRSPGVPSPGWRSQ